MRRWKSKCLIQFSSSRFQETIEKVAARGVETLQLRPSVVSHAVRIVGSVAAWMWARRAAALLHWC